MCLYHNLKMLEKWKMRFKNPTKVHGTKLLVGCPPRPWKGTWEGTLKLKLYYLHGKYFKYKSKVLVVQSCLTLCDLMDYSPPGSSIHGILQVRILEWVAIPFSNFKYVSLLKKKYYIKSICTCRILENTDKLKNK